MKILIINQHPQDVIGGSEIQADLIATYLTRFGHEVRYFAVDGKCAQYQTPYPVEPHPLNFRELIRVLAGYQPDLVYWRFNRRNLVSAVAACKLKKAKVVFAISSLTDVIKWAHRVNFQDLAFRERLKKLYSPWFLRHLVTMRLQYFGYYLVDGVIAQLDQQEDKLPVRKQVVIHNSVNRASTPFSWIKPFIVWVGSFKSVKHPEIYIELARRLAHTPVDFLMVGKTQGRYHELVMGPDRPGNLHVLGERPYPEVNGMLQQSLFLVQTSYVEGFPNVLIQAWMQGKPTVSLSYDPDNMIQTQQIGSVAGSFAQLVADTEALIIDERRRTEMGQRAQRYAEAHFDPESNMRKFEAFFREVCGKA